jgi:hypothetical protein
MLPERQISDPLSEHARQQTRHRTIGRKTSRISGRVRESFPPPFLKSSGRTMTALRTVPSTTVARAGIPR